MPKPSGHPITSEITVRPPITINRGAETVGSPDYFGDYRTTPLTRKEGVTQNRWSLNLSHTNTHLTYNTCPITQITYHKHVHSHVHIHNFNTYQQTKQTNSHSTATNNASFIYIFIYICLFQYHIPSTNTTTTTTTTHNIHNQTTHLSNYHLLQLQYTSIKYLSHSTLFFIRLLLPHNPTPDSFSIPSSSLPLPTNSRFITLPLPTSTSNTSPE